MPSTSFPAHHYMENRFPRQGPPPVSFVPTVRDTPSPTCTLTKLTREAMSGSVRRCSMWDLEETGEWGTNHRGFAGNQGQATMRKGIRRRNDRAGNSTAGRVLRYPTPAPRPCTVPPTVSANDIQDIRFNETAQTIRCVSSLTPYSAEPTTAASTACCAIHALAPLRQAR